MTTADSTNSNSPLLNKVVKITFFCFLALFGNTSNAESYLDSVEIELITISPGVNYWEAFGHSALRIKSKHNDFMYGFGYFNFNDEDFFLNFAKGEMQYFMGFEASDIELDDYQAQGRKITSQKISLNNSQKQQLINKLNFLQKPENRYYHYDYFLNNCTTKIRDILNEISNKAISKQLKAVKTNRSWSDLTFPVNKQSWMNLGIAIAYGLPAYAKHNRWDLSVFPESFAHDLSTIKSTSLKIQPEIVLYQPNQAESARFETDFWQTHFAIILVYSLLFLLLLFRLARNISINLWLIIQSLLGIGILLLWFFSKHTVAANNINILLFMPLSLLLLCKRFKTRKFIYTLLFSNILWLILASLFSNLYLFGFFVINIFSFIYLANKQ